MRSAVRRSSLTVRSVKAELVLLDRGVGVLEVEAGGDLALGLVDRVADLLAVDLGDDIETRHAARLTNTTGSLAMGDTLRSTIRVDARVAKGSRL